MGCPMTVCPFDGLPVLDQSVLLDIDTDYLVTLRVSYQTGEEHGSLPWRWPQDLVSGLQRKELRSDFVTISYSVEGGYTHLQWKYLGDELALRIGKGSCPDVLRGMEAIAQGARDAAAGDYERARAHFATAARLMPADAAPRFHLAHLHLATGDPERARCCYREAVKLDPSYQTPFKSPSIGRLKRPNLEKAEREFRRTLALDPEDLAAHLGLGKIAMLRRDRAEAEKQFRRALELDPKSLDAIRGMAETAGEAGRDDESIDL